MSVAFLGRPLLAHAIEAVQAAERDGTVRAAWVVVPDLEASAGRIAAGLGATVVPAPHSGRGMGWSLRAGIEAVAASAPAGPAAVLIVPGDQPRLRPDVLAALVRRWRATGAGVVRPRYAEDAQVPGHPVLVDRSRWRELEALEGDQGLRAMGREVEFVDVPGSNPDIDTRRDLAEQAREETD